jgi:hypothetical protein
MLESLDLVGGILGREGAYRWNAPGSRVDDCQLQGLEQEAERR